MNKKGHVLNAVLLAIGLGCIVEPSMTDATLVAILEVGVPVFLGALAPDVDTAFGYHRKTFHNLPVLIGFIIFPGTFDGNLQYVWIGVLTHYVLDVAGSKRGIALFYPLWKREFGLPIGVETSSHRADLVTALVTAGELLIAALVIHPPDRATLEALLRVVGL